MYVYPNRGPTHGAVLATVDRLREQRDIAEAALERIQSMSRTAGAGHSGIEAEATAALKKIRGEVL